MKLSSYRGVVPTVRDIDGGRAISCRVGYVEFELSYLDGWTGDPVAIWNEWVTKHENE